VSLLDGQNAYYVRFVGRSGSPCAVLHPVAAATDEGAITRVLVDFRPDVLENGLSHVLAEVFDGVVDENGTWRPTSESRAYWLVGKLSRCEDGHR